MNPKTPASRSRQRWRNLAAIPISLLGVMLLALAVSNRQGPRKVEVDERVLPVRTATVQRLEVIPRATGHGTTEPRRVWTSVAQASGVITYLADDVRVGSFVEEGRLIARIDPTDYENLVRQGEARLELIDAQLAVNRAETENTHSLLEIEKESERLASAEVERYRDLHGSGAVSASEYEKAVAAHLRAARTVQELANRLRTLDGRERELNAQRNLETERLSGARIDLERTAIHAPFDGIVSTFNVERGQYVHHGSALLRLDGTETVEIVAQFRESEFRRLLPTLREDSFPQPDLHKVLVYTGAGTNDTSDAWIGSFDRYSATFDPRTGTLGAVIRINQPYAQEGGPLRKGVFSRVELHGQPIHGALVIPRSAIVEGRVYVVDADNRLSIRQIAIEFVQGDLALVREGLELGERIIISDISPAIAGTKLAPEADPATDEQIAREANGYLHSITGTGG